MGLKYFMFAYLIQNDEVDLHGTRSVCTGTYSYTSDAKTGCNYDVLPLYLGILANQRKQH